MDHRPVAQPGGPRAGGWANGSGEGPRIDHSRIVHVHLGRASVLYLIGRNDEALAAAGRGLAFAKLHGDTKATAECLQRMSDVYAVSGRYDEMRRAVEQALILFQGMGDGKGLAQGLNSIGYLHNIHGEYPAALGCYERSLTLQREVGDRHGQAISLGNIGMVHRHTGDYAKALVRFRSAFEIHEGNGDREGMALTLSYTGSTHSLAGDHHRALDSHLAALRIRKEIGDRYGQAESLNNIGFLHNASGDYRGALEQYGKALTIQEEIGDRYGQAYSLNNIGVAQGFLGRHAEGDENLTRALAWLRDLGDLAGQAFCCSNIARNCLERADPVRARKSLDEARSIADRIGAKEVVRRTELLYGELALAAGLATDGRGGSEPQVQQALDHAALALRLAEELGSRAGRAGALLVMARAQALDGKIVVAEEKFREAISLLDGTGQRYESAVAHYRFADFLIAREQPDAAMVHLRIARDGFQQIGNTPWARRCGELLPQSGESP